MTQSSATQRGSEQADAQFNTDRTHPGRWTDQPEFLYHGERESLHHNLIG
jgi:hypothetical protein